MAYLTSSSKAKVITIGAIIVLIFLFAGFGGCRGIATFGPAQTGGASVEANEVKNIDIDWAAGSVTIEPYDGTTIELTETARNLTKSHEMRWSVSGSTLKIDYGSSFGCVRPWDKALTVKVPRNLAGSMGVLDIDGASGHYKVGGLALDKLKIDLASGDFTGNDIKAGELDINAASGKAEVDGVVTNRVKLDAASGRFRVILHEVSPKNVDVSLASGNITLGLPDNDGFTATIDKLSGNFTSSFETTNNGKTYTYKQGGTTSIKANMVSGNFDIVHS